MNGNLNPLSATLQDEVEAREKGTINSQSLVLAYRSRSASTGFELTYPYVIRLY